MKFDPRTKLLTITVLTTLSVFAPDWVYLSGMLSFTLVFDVLFGVNFWTAVKRLRFFIVTAVIIALLQDYMSGIAFFLRMSIILAACAIAMTSDSHEMTDALTKLKFPYEIGFSVSATLRFLPLLRDEVSNRVKAIAVRGVDIKKLRLAKKIKAYTFVLAPAVVGCAIKSRALADAMTTRAFRAYNKRTMLRELKFGLRDFVVMFVLAACIAAFIVLYFTV